MTKIEQAQVSADKKYQEYIAACQKVSDLIKAEEIKKQEKIAKIEEAFKAIKTPEVVKHVVTYVNSERVSMGLMPKHS